MTTIEVSCEALAVMEAAAQGAWPREACGLMLGEGTRIAQAVPCANVHPAPESRFEIDPQALIHAHRTARHGGPQVLGYFHSHPHGSATPSAIDAAMAAGDGMIWAILADGAVQFWRDWPGGFRPLSYALIKR